MKDCADSSLSRARTSRAGVRFLHFTAIAALTLCGCRQAAGNPQPLLDRAIVQVSITPGKPGAPTETVTATSLAGKLTLTVSRAPDGEKVEPVSATIAATDFQPLWDIIRERSLHTFRPEPRPGVVFDFGEIKMLVDSRAAPAENAENDGKAYNAVSWQTALNNQETVQPLISALAKLAAEKCAGVKLVYFR